MKMSLNYFREKIKGSEREIYVAILIIIVGMLSFGLGRLSKLEDQKVPIVIRSAAMAQNSLANASSPMPANTLTIGKYVASKNGTTYFLPWCTGVKKIREANRVWFDTEAEASAAGYSKAANCKGL